MMYYTFEGSYKEIKSIIKANYTEEFENDNEIDVFVNALLAISQNGLDMPAENYTSLIIDHGSEESAQLLWGDSQYDVKISVLAFEIIVLLVKVYLDIHDNGNIQLTLDVIDAVRNIFNNGIHKIDDSVYCTYKVLLSEAKNAKSIYIDYNSVTGKLKNPSCNKDFYKGGICPYLNSENGNQKCTICDDDIERALEILDKEKLILDKEKLIKNKDRTIKILF